MESDSTVPEDPRTCKDYHFEDTPGTSCNAGISLQPPSMVCIEPPTPLCLTPSPSRPSLSSQKGDLPCTGLRAPPITRATFRVDSMESEHENTDEYLTGHLKQSSDSELQSLRTSSAYDMRPSFSDSSILEHLETSSPDASRKISKGSAFRFFDRASSPQRGFLPAFRRGLITSGLTGGSLIAEVLLLNANILGVAATPLMDFDDVPM